ncbi:MAG: rRNA (guanosine2251-2-O)-methyltransferase [Thermoanaerobaculia bacterium]|jgi:23S rRNA (guanosine2251-2'-O)-methyltransferase|nr:rRNA (guanosine2251-2-O)-methyltransferase [Thermoanaerobaculia bacterium]
MIIYGVNPILEAIRSHPERIRYVGVAREETARHQRLMGEAKRAGVAVRNLALDQIDRLAGRGVHNGVLAEVSETAYADFEEIVEKEETNFVLIIDSITDPQNFGAILRVADGFGVDLVVIPQHDSVGLTPVAVKASAGASEWVQVAQVTNLSRAIETLKKGGYWIYAAAENGERPDAIDFTGKVALVVGNEGKGIRRNVLDHCDRTVTIPMSGHIESFNVATATAILCYEIRRQQR